MKKTALFLSFVSVMAILSSCCNQPATVQEPAMDPLQISDPELWAAQNQTVELKPDRGVMENPIDLGVNLNIKPHM